MATAVKLLCVVIGMLAITSIVLTHGLGCQSSSSPKPETKCSRLLTKLKKRCDNMKTVLEKKGCPIRTTSCELQGNRCLPEEWNCTQGEGSCESDHQCCSPVQENVSCSDGALQTCISQAQCSAPCGTVLADIGDCPTDTFCCKRKCGATADIFLAVDGFYQNDEEYDLVKSLLTSMIAEWPIGPEQFRVGFLLAAQFHVLLKHDYNKQQLQDFISAEPSFPSSFYDTDYAFEGLKDIGFSSFNGNRPEVPDIIIHLTDYTPSDMTEVFFRAQELKQANIKLVTVGVGSDVSIAYLNEIASDPNDSHVFCADTAADLSSLKDPILNRVCAISQGCP